MFHRLFHEDLCVQPIEQIDGDGRHPNVEKFRKLRESYWMKELPTIFPYGLNDRCGGLDWTKKESDKIAASLFNKITVRRTHSGSRKTKWSKKF